MLFPSPVAASSAQLLTFPETLAAGDQWEFVAALTDYAAVDGWSAVLMLRGPTVRDATGVSGADGWTFTIPADESTSFVAGRYAPAIRVTRALERVTLAGSAITVTPDFATLTEGALLSHEERSIPLLEAAIQKRVTIDLASYTITDRQATREDLATMVKLLARYRAAITSQQGGGFPADIAVEFGRAY